MRTVVSPSNVRTRCIPLTFGAMLVIEHTPASMGATKRYFRRSAKGHITSEWTREEAALYSQKILNRPAAV